MNKRLMNLLLLAALSVFALTGCRAAPAVDTPNESAGTAARPGSVNQVPPVLTVEEAKTIALNHAGLTADQVTALRAEYDSEHATPKYEVEFHHESWEYDYEIHADTGDILSFSKDH